MTGRSIIAIIVCGCYGGIERMMTATVHKGLLFGFSVELRNNEAVLVSHLLFVDETLIFCESNFELLQLLFGLSSWL
jgi:hypothetical protein